MLAHLKMLGTADLPSKLLETRLHTGWSDGAGNAGEAICLQQHCWACFGLRTVVLRGWPHLRCSMHNNGSLRMGTSLLQG